ncbi:MAG TPA: restriction endonuclease subunit S [Ktedonobacteraceae bacterium]|nr:restriction endonuclease subunit S [Ktedonobacteraceae bacterium]
MKFDTHSIPADWNITTIGECCDILDYMRIPVNTEKRLNRQGNIPYYGANGQQGWIDDYIFDEELVLIAEDGGNFDDYANRPISYMIRGKSWVNNHAHILRAKENTSNSWILYNLVHRDIRSYIQGGTRAKLNQSELRTIELALPPLSEQHCIVTILDSIDSQIHLTEQLIAKLKLQREGLLHDLLTRGLDEHGQLRDPVAHPELFKDSVLGRIPKDWKVDNILNHVSLPQGQVDPKRFPFRDWPLIAPDHIESGTGRIISIQTAAQQNAISGKYTFLPGDVLYSKIRPYLRKATLADREGLCSADMYPLRPKDTMDSHFLLAIILGEHFSRFAIAVSMRSGFPKINRNELGEYIVALPPYQEQKAIANTFISLDNEIRVEQAHRDKLKLYKQGLMQDLLTGRVRVSAEESLPDAYQATL